MADPVFKPGSEEQHDDYYGHRPCNRIEEFSDSFDPAHRPPSSRCHPSSSLSFGMSLGSGQAPYRTWIELVVVRGELPKPGRP